MLNSRSFTPPSPPLGKGGAGGFPAALATVFAVAALLTLAAHPSVGLAQDPPPVGVYDEEEAQSIDRMLMCPVCPAESIDQAQVELARQMRQKVRELLAEGYTRQEVLDYFEERYGPKVLAAPPKRGAHIAAWALPIGSVLLGTAIGFVILRSMKRSSTAGVGAVREAPLQQEDKDLQPYLEEVDRGLAFDDTAGATVGATRESPLHPAPTLEPGDGEEGEGKGDLAAGLGMVEEDRGRLNEERNG